MRQQTGEMAAQLRFRHLMLRYVIAAEIVLVSLMLKPLYHCVFDSRKLLQGCFYFTGFHTVAIDLDHGIDPPRNEKIAVIQDLSRIAGMKEAAPHCFFRLLRHPVISSEKRIFKTDLPLFASRYFAVILIQNPDTKAVKHRPAGRSDFIPSVNDILGDGES